MIDGIEPTVVESAAPTSISAGACDRGVVAKGLVNKSCLLVCARSAGFEFA